jgi:hypothetical protein
MTAHVPHEAFRAPKGATPPLARPISGNPDQKDRPGSHRQPGTAPRAATGRRHQLALAVQLYQQGETSIALSAIRALVNAHPAWAEGYTTLAQLLWQSGQPAASEALLIAAVHGHPDDPEMVISCLRLLSDAGLHESVDSLIPEVRAALGDHLFFTLLEALAASELGDMGRADALYAQAAAQGGALSLPHVRHLLKRGKAAEAAALAEEFVTAQPANQSGWGLLSTAWRLTGDPRHAWLVEQPGLVRAIDIDIEDGALDRLAKRLRKLHVSRTHPFDQSLRGGTQTTGDILMRSEPELTTLHRALTRAIQDYLDGLPPYDAAHPLLGRGRESFNFSDSWSVRLLDGGFHISHTHPQGSISAAFYVTLPPPCDDDPHAGWLTLGAPPAELGLHLPPLQLIEPKPGRLACFPSFLWHGTLPFPQGERMTVAFDTVLPA